MIAPAYVRTMAAYNAEMNRRVSAAAGRLSDAARRADQGGFWRSVHGTLCHLLWGDSVWMSRFDGWEAPGVGIGDSGTWIADFDELVRRRAEADGRIEAWAARLDAGWLDGELTWFSKVAQRQITAPRGFLVTHMFNHQTHHRGQVHAMLTRLGEDTGDTDLFLVTPPAV